MGGGAAVFPKGTISAATGNLKPVVVLEFFDSLLPFLFFFVVSVSILFLFFRFVLSSTPLCRLSPPYCVRAGRYENVSNRDNS